MLYDANATTDDLDAAHIEIALLPVGAVEQHSIHLPLGTDWISAEALARRVGELLGAERDVLLLPALPFSLSECHGPMPGTVWLKPETLAAVLKEVVLALEEQGIRCIAVINGHGGNFALDNEIRELNARSPELIVINAVAWDVESARAATGRVVGGDIHAGAGETASQLHLDPAHVRPEHVDYSPSVGREFLDYATMEHISPWGVWGYPSEATAEQGAEALRWGAENMARNILCAFGDIAARREARP